MKQFKYVLIIVSGWFILIFLLNPFGEFPLNDDWAFSIPVKNLVEQGDLAFSPWAMMSLVAQVLWGSLFCLPFGFSFTALRISTLVAAIILSIIVFKLFSKREIGNGKAMLFTACLVLHPVMLNLSFTFMTDIPFMLCFILSVWFFLRYFESAVLSHFWMAMLFAFLATFIRQSGFLIPVAGLAAVIAYRPAKKEVLLFGILSGALTLLIIAWEVKLKFYFGVPEGSRSFLVESGFAFRDLLNAFEIFLKLVIKLFLFCGLAFLPLFFVAKNKLSLKRIATAALIGAIVTLLLGLRNDWFPFSFNIWMEGGTGPVALKEIYNGYPESFPMHWSLKMILTLLAATGAVFFFLPPHEEKCRAKSLSGRSFYFIVFLTFICLAALSFRGPFDRYVTPLMVLLPLLFIRSFPEGKIKFPGYAAAVLTFLFSIAAVNQYLSWNEGRWILLNKQIHIGVPPSKIDGGFEFNGLYGYDPSYEPPVDKSWWWVRDDSLVVGFNPLPGYEKIDSSSFQTILPWKTRNIYMFRRTEISNGHY